MEKNRKWIYFRYAFPSVVVLLAIIFSFVPCFKFVTGNGQNEAISVAQLMGNSWKWSTECLWGTDIEQTLGHIYFSQTAIALVVILWVLFLIGAVASVYITVSAFLCFLGARAGEKNRIIFITFTFNRIVCFVLQCLLIPMFAYPRMLPLLYRKTLNTYVELRLVFVDPLIIVALLCVIAALLSILMRKAERKLGIDIFARPDAQEEEISDTVEEVADIEESDYERMNRKAREEQAEKIIQLLSKKKNDDEE